MVFKRLLCLSLLFVVSLIFSSPALAADSPVALLNSGFNANAYGEQHLGVYEDDYAEFKRTIASANVRYDEVTDFDATQSKERLVKYKLVIVPMLVDLPPYVVSGLGDFVRAGGKIIITDGGGSPGGGAQSLMQMAGVKLDSQYTFKDPARLVWTNSPLPVSDNIAVGSMVAKISVSPEAKTLAKWEANATAVGAAVVRKDNVAYLGWVPGMQGDLMVNARYIAMVLDDLSPGITQEAAVQISFAEYQTIKSELEYLTNRTQEAIKTAKQAEFAVPYQTIQSAFDTAVQNVKAFDTAYKDRRFAEADECLARARFNFGMAFGQAMPVRPVEARCIWLDRGTIEPA